MEASLTRFLVPLVELNIQSNEGFEKGHQKFVGISNPGDALDLLLPLDLRHRHRLDELQALARRVEEERPSVVGDQQRALVGG